MFSSLFILLTAIAPAAYAATTTCNVLNYGGVANNETDIAPAIMKAYSECVSRATTQNPTDTVLIIPSGTYALRTAVTFRDAHYFTILINGDLDLKFKPKLAGNMFLFDHCNYVVWKGNGSIHGHGDLWRPNRNLGAYPSRPRLVRFQDCNNIDMSGVALFNAPMFHVVIIGNNNVAHDMQTDAFDVSGNNNHVHDVFVQNGDECVTVKAPTNGFVAENIQCRYSAGCNIGSFGTKATGVSVQNVYYRNVTHIGGAGGIVVKSYPSASGIVRNVTYVDFTFKNVDYPVQIDEYWCPHMRECPQGKGNLIVQDVTFKSISGTSDSSSRPLVYINCLSKQACNRITFEDVNLTKEGNTEGTMSISNACGSGLRELDACS